MGNKTILFLTGTRADYGKLKPLIRAVESSHNIKYEIFITGMHTLSLYGRTELEVKKDGFKNLFTFMNQHHEEPMEEVLANTITGLSRYVHEKRPDMIVVHGDRVEALAGAIVGSINNILVGHVEGGEKSGTIDELIRHSVTKMSHVHFVCSEDAKSRLLQMGEVEDAIYNIGSPDIDVMLNDAELPSLSYVKSHYQIKYESYGILLYHSVTTELDCLAGYVEELIEAVKNSEFKFVVVLPNNDEGSSIIRLAYEQLKQLPNCHLFPSIKFESFLTLLKFSQFIVGNSSAGVREAPVYGVPAINIGNRQSGRTESKKIINCGHDSEEISQAIKSAVMQTDRVRPPEIEFGGGDSAAKFLAELEGGSVWGVNIQKNFVDRQIGNVK